MVKYYVTDTRLDNIIETGRCYWFSQLSIHKPEMIFIFHFVVDFFL